MFYYNGPWSQYNSLWNFIIKNRLILQVIAVYIYTFFSVCLKEEATADGQTAQWWQYYYHMNSEMPKSNYNTWVYLRVKCYFKLFPDSLDISKLRTEETTLESIFVETSTAQENRYDIVYFTPRMTLNGILKYH